MLTPNTPGRLLGIEPVAPRPGADHAAFLRFADDHGRVCLLYVALALPRRRGPAPVVIHAPGGTQTVDEADLRFWAGHGFACAAFDWQHDWQAWHVPGRKSAWPGGVVMQGAPAMLVPQLILPLAIRAVGVVLDWLATISRCDTGRAGMTGISWGGYLTWLAGAHEPRLKALVPTYGCGGLFAPDRRPPHLAPAPRAFWRRHLEPTALSRGLRTPLCWLSAANDFFGWSSVGSDLIAGRPERRQLVAPNLDHAVDAAAGALAVAWMRHHLAGGPALPPAPRWRGRAVTAPGANLEPWWAPDAGPDDLHCWWPGDPPEGLAAWRLVLARTDDGLAQSAPLRRVPGRRRWQDLGPAWPDLRAGLGWHWGWGTTQLHGAAGVGITALDGDPRRVCVQGRGGSGTGSLLLYQPADPRWNRPGTIGLSLVIEDLPAGTPLTWTVTLAQGRQRIQRTATTRCRAGGRAVLRWRDLPDPPRGSRWTQVRRVELAGLPLSGVELSDLRRLA